MRVITALLGGSRMRGRASSRALLRGRSRFTQARHCTGKLQHLGYLAAADVHLIEANACISRVEGRHTRVG